MLWPELELFCAVASGTNYTASSSDGITWKYFNFRSYIGCLAFCLLVPDLGKFCAVANGTGNTMTSTNGTTWINHAMGANYNSYSICWLSELQLFVVVTYGSITVQTSPDGITWTPTTTGIVSANWGKCMLEFRIKYILCCIKCFN